MNTKQSLVERLRKSADHDDPHGKDVLLNEAADRIEELERQLAAPLSADDIQQLAALWEEITDGRTFTDNELAFARALLAQRAAPQAQGSGKDAAMGEIVEDMRMLIVRLARSLAKAAPGNDLPERAMDYLNRKGLHGSPLRAAAPQEAPMTGAQNDANQPETRMDTGNALVLDAPQQEPVAVSNAELAGLIYAYTGINERQFPDEYADQLKLCKAVVNAAWGAAPISAKVPE